MRPLASSLLVISILAMFLTKSISCLGADPSVKTTVMGKLENGREVHEYLLVSTTGMRARIIDYGATIIDLQVPDATGQFSNVILGSDKLEVYLRGFPAASVIGRYANRIKNASFPLEGRDVSVTKNAGANHIHGGRTNFAKVLWKGNPRVVDGIPQVELQYESPDGEEGFPGRMLVTVRYELKEKNTLAVRYEAVSDKTTVVNLTNHAYFNLTGAGDVLNHDLQLNADRYTEVDSALIPTGVVSAVAGTPLDFRTPHRIGERIDQLASTRGYDHNYIVNGDAGILRMAARVVDPRSGRTMECWTTEPGVQLYTANGFNGNPFPKHGAFCLETQHYPDSPNRPEFPSTILKSGDRFQSVTEFRFGVR